jgi:hypothetical protein
MAQLLTPVVTVAPYSFSIAFCEILLSIFLLAILGLA